jgi:hypothetical protein
MLLEEREGVGLSIKNKKNKKTKTKEERPTHTHCATVTTGASMPFFALPAVRLITSCVRVHVLML